MLDMAKEMRAAGLAYEMTEASQMTHLLNGVTPERKCVVATTTQGEVVRVFYGYYYDQSAIDLKARLEQRHSVTNVQIIAYVIGAALTTIG